jgi:methylmalonyl-CoA/ethylmalonyl-CoA epimerase
MYYNKIILCYNKQFVRGKNMQGIDHIGIAVKSIDEALPFYTNILQFKHVGTEIVESQKVKVAFINAINCKIELLEPTDEKSPIHKFLQKRGEGIHHIALTSKDIEGNITYLKEENIQLIDESPRIGAGGALVSFLHPKSCRGVLYELCQHKEDE